MLHSPFLVRTLAGSLASTFDSPSHLTHSSLPSKFAGLLARWLALTLISPSFPPSIIPSLPPSHIAHPASFVRSLARSHFPLSPSHSQCLAHQIPLPQKHTRSPISSLLGLSNDASCSSSSCRYASRNMASSSFITGKFSQKTTLQLCSAVMLHTLHLLAVRILRMSDASQNMASSSFIRGKISQKSALHALSCNTFTRELTFGNI